MVLTDGSILLGLSKKLRGMLAPSIRVPLGFIDTHGGRPEWIRTEYIMDKRANPNIQPLLVNTSMPTVPGLSDRSRCSRR